MLLSFSLVPEQNKYIPLEIRAGGHRTEATLLWVVTIFVTEMPKSKELDLATLGTR
jgi:hypothetical protein